MMKTKLIYISLSLILCYVFYLTLNLSTHSPNKINRLATGFLDSIFLKVKDSLQNQKIDTVLLIRRDFITDYELGLIVWRKNGKDQLQCYRSFNNSHDFIKTSPVPADTNLLNTYFEKKIYQVNDSLQNPSGISHDSYNLVEVYWGEYSNYFEYSNGLYVYNVLNLTPPPDLVNWLSLVKKAFNENRSGDMLEM